MMKSHIVGLAALVLASTWGSEAKAQTTLIPPEVIAQAQRLGASNAANFCPSNPSYYGTTLASLKGKRPPTAIVGLNSRMDNAQRVRGVKDLWEISSLASSAAAHIMVTRNAAKADQLLDVLATWARSGAFTKTKSCTRNGKFTGDCTEWTRSDGRDLSDDKDFSTTQMAMASVRTSYFATVSRYKAKERASDHMAIRQWLDTFYDRQKRPTNVYLGLKTGWYWPEIEKSYSDGNARKAKSLTTKLLKGLNKLMLKDGSIKDRTTRGDRALWYHSTAIGEIMTAMEMGRTLGAKFPRDMEAKLQKSVDLFVRSVQNPANIDPWAKVAHNATYRPNFQEYNRKFWNNDFGHSWVHIYVYRYPERAASIWIASRLPRRSISSMFDQDTGVASGCIYQAASAAR